VLNRHICQTCGFVIPSTQGIGNDASKSAVKDHKSGFWQKFLGLDTGVKEPKEPGREEPVLGEV
jgi:hypothetical protein